MNRSAASRKKRDLILEKADQYAHAAYKLSRQLPKDELFGLTSQLRRASLSVPLNIIEGYGRQSRPAQRQFLLVAFGSLKESQYLLQFCIEENYLSSREIEAVYKIGDEAARMLWRKIQTLKSHS